MTNSTPVRAIRLKCLDCSNGSAHEVKLCVIPHCPLYPYRMGKNPNIRREYTEEQRMAMTASLRKTSTATRDIQREQTPGSI